MKKINIQQIGNKPFTVDILASEDWVKEVFENIFANRQKIDWDSIKGKLTLDKIERNINCTGHIEFTRHPQCARCGQELAVPESFGFTIHLAPLYSSPQNQKKHQDEEEDIELTKDDLNISFYENDEIRLDTLLNDEVALQIPYNDYCPKQENCQLSQIDSKENPNITLNDTTDPRWAALKDLKFTKNKV